MKLSDMKQAVKNLIRQGKKLTDLLGCLAKDRFLSKSVRLLKAEDFKG
jgi:hypothetical protein